jgi:type I restriction enzyme S subunit
VEQVSSLKTGVKYKDTPIGRIPVDWEVVELADICDEIYRYPTYYNLNYVDRDHGVPEIRGELIRENGELSKDLLQYRYISRETSLKFPKTILREGDFVITVRGTLGKIGCVSGQLEHANITANLMRISPSRKRVYHLWLRQYLLSDFFQNRLNEISSATTIKTIKAPELKSIKLAIPPYSEQKKIAEILRTVDEAIERTNLIIDKTRELKRGLMQRLFTRGIGHTKFKNTAIGRIPEEWRIAAFGDLLSEGILSEIQDGNHGNDHPKQGDYVSSGIPFIMANNLVNGTVDTSNCKFIRKEQADRLRVGFAKPGDVLLSHKGTIGRIAIVPGIDGYVMLTPQVTYYRIGQPEKLSNVFLKYFMEGGRFQTILSILSAQSTRNYIGITQQKRLAMPLPSIAEQYKIAETLSHADRELEKELNHLNQLRLLKKGLMQVLLTGRIRVAV